MTDLHATCPVGFLTVLFVRSFVFYIVLKNLLGSLCIVWQTVRCEWYESAAQSNAGLRCQLGEKTWLSRIRQNKRLQSNHTWWSQKHLRHEVEENITQSASPFCLWITDFLDFQGIDQLCMQNTLQNVGIWYGRLFSSMLWLFRL